MPDISCPECSQSIPYHAQEAGRRIPCPTCGHPFVLPTVATYAPPIEDPRLTRHDDDEPEPADDRDEPPDDGNAYSEPAAPAPRGHRPRYRPGPPLFDHRPYARWAVIAIIIHAAAFVIGYVFIISAIDGYVSSRRDSIDGLSGTKFWIGRFLLLISALAWLAAFILFSAWAVCDARARGAFAPELWAVLMLISWDFAAIVYILTRPRGTLTRCTHCRGLGLDWATRCVHCER